MARSLRLIDNPRSRWLGLAAAVAAVAATTLAIYPLREVAPAVSTGVLYLLPVLLASTYWGLWLGLGTAVASAAAFNFFHIVPTGQFTIADPEHWVALAVYLVAAVVASTLAGLARARAVEAERRREEADLAAGTARTLLGQADLDEALRAASRRLAEALGVPRAEIVLGQAPAGPPAVPLGPGALVLPGADAATVARIAERVAPWLEPLLRTALDREALQAEVVETAALRRSDVIKTALLRAVSHDLRSPLTAIIAAGDAVRSPQLAPTDRDELGALIVGEAGRLAQMVDKLLDLSRLQSGEAAPRRDWCSIEEVIGAAVSALPPGGAPVEVSVDRDLPLVEADAAQLERVFANLLENAQRHSGGHPVKVRARVVGGRMRVRVIDRGPGLAPAQLERVFEPFYRSAGDHGGSGLGLAIVRGFVEANGGRVWAESLPGQGTVFAIDLPVAPVPAAVEASAK